MAQGHMGAIRRIPCSPGRRHRGDLCIREKTEKMKKSIFLVLVAVGISAPAADSSLLRWLAARGATAPPAGRHAPPAAGAGAEKDPAPRPAETRPGRTRDLRP